MIFIKHTLELMVNPFFFAFILLAFCCFAYRKCHPLVIRSLLFTALLVLLIISTGWLPQALTQKLESQYPVIKQVNPKVRWIVVFSGGQNDVKGLPVNDLLVSASIKRLIEGIRLARRLPKARIVLSGGGSTGETAEAFHLLLLADWFAITPQRIVLETQSINTADQAKELVPIVHKAPFYLVTSAIHMPRSMALCRELGLNPIAAPTDFTFFWEIENQAKWYVPNTYNLYYFNIAMHEILGRMWQKLNSFFVTYMDSSYL